MRDERAACCGTGTVSCRRRVRGPVRPDERDTQPGRERPPRDRARDRVRGVAEGVAHAPAASLLSARGLHRTHARHKTPRDLAVSNCLAFNDMRHRSLLAYAH